MRLLHLWVTDLLEQCSVLLDLVERKSPESDKLASSVQECKQVDNSTETKSQYLAEELEVADLRQQLEQMELQILSATNQTIALEIELDLARGLLASKDLEIAEVGERMRVAQLQFLSETNQRKFLQEDLDRAHQLVQDKEAEIAALSRKMQDTPQHAEETISDMAHQLAVCRDLVVQLSKECQKSRADAHLQRGIICSMRKQLKMFKDKLSTLSRRSREAAVDEWLKSGFELDD